MNDPGTVDPAPNWAALAANAGLEVDAELLARLAGAAPMLACVQVVRDLDLEGLDPLAPPRQVELRA